MAKSDSTQLPPQAKDETGNVYGKLTVLRFVGRTNSGDSRWECRCECGKLTTVPRGDLRKSYGGTKSCGCWRARAGGATIGGNSPEYTTWREMKRRCYNPSFRDYHLYGGAGIAVCERWRSSFANFLADMGPKPFPSATIHRIDGQAGYSPENCKWASKEEQALYTSKARQITHNGETKSLRGWARRFGVHHATMKRRLNEGLTMDEIAIHYRT